MTISNNLDENVSSFKYNEHKSRLLDRQVRQTRLKLQLLVKTII